MLQSETVHRTYLTTLVQQTIRLRADQKARLDDEVRARGGTLTDALRENLDLAFAMKAELSKIVEGEFDQTDPASAPKLVHSLLFRVEERILGALDGISRMMEEKLFNGSVTDGAFHRNGGRTDKVSESVRSPRELAEAFITLLTEDSDYPTAVWVGAFLEMVPRLRLVTDEQIKELEHKGEEWLEALG